MYMFVKMMHSSSGYEHNIKKIIMNDPKDI